jgi:hypothetical protein
MKPAVTLALSLFAAAFVCGCAPAASLAQTPVSFTTIQKGIYSGVREPLQVVIRSQQEWAALWSRHASGRHPAAPPPDIDFSAEMVVGLFLGEKSTGGYSVEITTAELAGSRLHVYYRERSPARDALVTQVMTQPHHLIRLPKSEAAAVFIQEGR